jgi:hypothetical protein
MLGKILEKDAESARYEHDMGRAIKGAMLREERDIIEALYDHRAGSEQWLSHLWYRAILCARMPFWRFIDSLIEEEEESSRIMNETVCRGKKKMNMIFEEILLFVPVTFEL